MRTRRSKAIAPIVKAIEREVQPSPTSVVPHADDEMRDDE
jgi:hypothetical protein